MRLDRRLTDDEARGDLLVRQAAPDQDQDLALSFGQCLDPARIDVARTSMRECSDDPGGDAG